MDDAFRGRVAVLFEKLRDLSADGDWRFDLQSALSGIEYSDVQVDAIKRSATPSFLNGNTGSNGAAVFPKLREELTHAFTDSVRNSAFCMDMISDPRLKLDNDFAMRVLTRARMALREIVYNYPRLLGSEMPGSVQQILNAYENDALPMLDSLIGDLSEESGINPDTITPADTWQHLHTLPPEVF